MTISEEQSDGTIETLMKEDQGVSAKTGIPTDLLRNLDRIQDKLEMMQDDLEMLSRLTSVVRTQVDESILNDVLQQWRAENVDIPNTMQSSSPMLNPQMPLLDYFQKLATNKDINNMSIKKTKDGNMIWNASQEDDLHYARRYILINRKPAIKLKVGCIVMKAMEVLLGKQSTSPMEDIVQYVSILKVRKNVAGNILTKMDNDPQNPYRLADYVEILQDTSHYYVVIPAEVVTDGKTGQLSYYKCYY